MRFLLELKHWQLFLLTWGPALLLNIVVFIDIRLLLYAFPVAMLLFALGALGWVWAIANQLHPLAPAEAGLKIGLFRKLFLAPVVYLLLLPVLIGGAYFRGSGELTGSSIALFAALIVACHLLSIACIMCGLRFAAKTLKSVELQREARLSDYVGEFFLLWFSVVGVWVLQPRLNALVGQTRPRP